MHGIRYIRRTHLARALFCLDLHGGKIQCGSPKTAKRILDDLYWTATWDIVRRRESPSNIVGRRWTPWDIVGHRRTPSEAVGHRWTPLETVGHRWTPLDTVGHRWTPLDTVGHRWTPGDTVECVLFSLN